MLDGLLHLVQSRPWHDVAVDIFDICLVYYMIYRVLLVMRGTRAMQIGVGLAVVLVVYFVSRWAGLVTLFNMLSSLLSSLILVIVVVFQNDIRRGLMRVGSSAVFSKTSQQQETRVVDEVVAAATELARHRMGALICFEQEANLDEFVASGGTAIDAAVQRDLLVSLFVPEGVNRLHDGAVIIRNLRVALAGVFFPMPEAKGVDKSMGTRHRAAVGVSDETDAVVVVVSEERGTISVCFNGNIIPNLDGVMLRHALLGLFGESSKKKKKSKIVPPVSRKPTAGPKSDDRGKLKERTPVPLSAREALAARDSLTTRDTLSSRDSSLRDGVVREVAMRKAATETPVVPLIASKSIPPAAEAIELRLKPSEEPVTTPMQAAVPSSLALPDSSDGNQE